MLYLDKGKYNKAISYYTKAIKLDPNYTYTYYDRGNAYCKKGDYGQAILDYPKQLN